MILKFGEPTWVFEAALYHRHSGFCQTPALEWQRLQRPRCTVQQR